MKNSKIEIDIIRRNEESLLSMDVRSNINHLDILLSDDFKEFGASGQIFDKQKMMELLISSNEKWNYIIEDYNNNFINQIAVLLTYKLSIFSLDDKLIRKSLRSSLWIKKDEQWQIQFHQGTKIKI